MCDLTETLGHLTHHGDGVYLNLTLCILHSCKSLKNKQEK